MLGGIGHRHARLLRQFLHAVFSLGQHLEEFEAVRTRQGFANARKLLIEVILEGSLLLLVHVCHALLSVATSSPTSSACSTPPPCTLPRFSPPTRTYPTYAP